MSLSEETARSKAHHLCGIQINGIELPESLLEAVSQALLDFRFRLLSGLRLELLPGANGNVAPGTENFVAVFSIPAFTFRFKGLPALGTGESDVDASCAHSSSPINSEPSPTDSQSTGCDESVADQSRPEASYTNRIKAAAALAELLPQSALDSLVTGELNAATDALLHEAAANELLLRRRA